MTNKTICHYTFAEINVIFLSNYNLVKHFNLLYIAPAGKYGLKHKSKGSGANRRLMVWKEEKSVREFLCEPVTELEPGDEYDTVQVILSLFLLLQNCGQKLQILQFLAVFGSRFLETANKNCMAGAPAKRYSGHEQK